MTVVTLLATYTLFLVLLIAAAWLTLDRSRWTVVARSHRRLTRA